MQNTKKRIAIYAIYDPDGILDGYRKYFLQQVRPYFDRLLVVANGELTKESRKELSSLCDDFFVRENTYALWGAWHDGINHITFQELDNYDQLFLLNDAQFGPLFSLDDFFLKMEKSDADYYGILGQFELPKVTKNSNGVVFKHGHIMGSISYFFVIKERLLHSSEFRAFYGRELEEVPMEVCVPDHTEIEHNFYDFVHDAGFQVDFYMSKKGFEYSPDHQYNNLAISIIEDRVPFARIKSFACDGVTRGLSANYNQYHRKTLEYIDKHTDYDINLIWDYLLRTKNLTHIYTQMQLQYVVPSCIVEKTFSYSKTIAVIIHIYYEDMVEEISNYCVNFIPNTDFYISTTDEATKLRIEEEFAARKLNFKCTIKPNLGAAESTLWITYADVVTSGKYEYICFLHDKKSPYIGYSSYGYEHAKRCMDNLFGSREIVKNIINLFEENPRMGLLGPPIMYHNNLFNAPIRAWLKWNYQLVSDFAGRIGLRVDISEKTVPVAPHGTMFWFRSNALKKAIDFGFTYDDFYEHKKHGTICHAMENSYGLIAQDSGYYYADIINSDAARSDLVNYKHLLDTISCICLKQNTEYYNFSLISHHLSNQNKSIAYHKDCLQQKQQHIENLYHQIAELQARLDAIDKSRWVKLIRIIKGHQWGK